MSSIEPMTSNHIIRRKRTFSKTYTFQDADGNPYDLTGYSICAQARKEQRVDADLIFEYNMDLSDAINGNVTITLDEDETNCILESTGFWDMLFEQGDIKETWLEGKIEVRGSVTDTTL